jgi:hypothetical protein
LLSNNLTASPRGTNQLPDNAAHQLRPTPRFAQCGLFEKFKETVSCVHLWCNYQGAEQAIGGQ